MKKRVVVCALALCLLLASCGMVSGQGEPERATDAQNQYALFNAISFQETDSFYCGGAMTDDHLYYYDKETGISGILCADPSCSHSTSSCGAYVKSGATMFLYDGQRYWITDVNTEGNDYVLWKGDMAGTNQTKVKEISFDDIILPYQPQQYAIHRGSIYFLGTADTVSGVDISVRLTLMGSPLDDSEAFAALFDQTYNANVNATVRYVGNYAFLLVQTWTEVGSVDLTIYKIDLNSGETEIIYEGLGGTSCGGFWVTEQEEIYFAKQTSVGKVEDGVFVPVVTLKHSEDVVKLMDGIAVSTYLEDDSAVSRSWIYPAIPFMTEKCSLPTFRKWTVIPMRTEHTVCSLSAVILIS